MVCFLWHELGALVKLNLSFTVNRYVQLHEDHLQQPIFMYPSNDGIFMDGNAPCHRATKIFDFDLKNILDNSSERLGYHITQHESHRRFMDHDREISSRTKPCTRNIIAIVDAYRGSMAQYFHR